MASRRRNIKTHPPLPDPDEAGFQSPERTDLTLQGTEDAVMIDLNAGNEAQGEQVINANGENDQGGGTDEGQGNGEQGQGEQRQGRERRPERTERQPRQQAQGNGNGNYSKAVRERVRRERNLLNRERELREQTQRELAVERTARQAQDQRIAALERQQTTIASNSDVKDLEGKIASLKDRLIKAKEAGETALEMDLTIQLTDATADLKVLRFKLETQQAEATRQAEERNRQQQQQGNNNGQASANPLTPDERATAADWTNANKHWFNRPSQAAAKADCIVIDREILGEIRAGNLDMDLYSDEHLEELARRLRDIHPDLPVVDLDGNDYEFSNEDDEDEENDMRDERDNNRRGPRDDDRRNGGRQTNQRGQRMNGGNGGRAPQGGIGQGGRRQPDQVQLARDGRVTLEAADFATMRTFGMDPNNNDHKKAFAKERRRSILTDAARGTR